VTRRPLLKRFDVWMATAIFAVVVYVLGAPMVVSMVMPRFPSTVPLLQVLYWPVGQYTEHPDWPGSTTYTRYAGWCESQLAPEQPVILMPPPQPARSIEVAPSP
jgi:hypothetical protein